MARPLPAGAVVDKFRDNARRALDGGRVAALERAVLALDRVDDVRDIANLCRS